MEEDNIEIAPKQCNISKYKILIKFIIIILVFIFFIYFLSPPLNSKDTIIHIRSGQSVNSIYKELENKNVIRSSVVLRFILKILKSKSSFTTGDYLIRKNSSVCAVAWQIGRGKHNIEPIKVTIREGLTNLQIADILINKLPDFDKEKFLNVTKDKQGYLFPDTYFFFPLDTTDEIIVKLSNNFDFKIKNIYTFDFKNKSLSDIITMASILEGEASGQEDIGIISGILWKRISMGMPLQVDVDKSTYEDKGLPKKPLNNPGLDSIKASLNPIDSKYLYYLHDKNGTVHYGMTFEEHKLNIKKYLK